jgi:predicted transposase YdaD
LVDSLAKQIIGLDPAFWVALVTERTDLQVEAALDAEFRLLFRQSDSLVRMVDPAGEHYLVVFELQHQYDATMPRRMNAYAALAEETYGLPVFPVVINFQPPPVGAAALTLYESHCLGLGARREFRALNLWELPADQAFQPESRPC